MPERSRRFPADALPLLRCPLCGAGFSPTSDSLRCPNGHSYDVARQGYVNLLPGGARPGTADTAEMVAARERVPCRRSLLAGCATSSATRRNGRGGSAGPRGRGQPRIRRAASWRSARAPATTWPECSTASPAAWDSPWTSPSSRRAARRAHTSAWRPSSATRGALLPVADACASLILDVFAPRNAAGIPAGATTRWRPARGHTRHPGTSRSSWPRSGC